MSHYCCKKCGQRYDDCTCPPAPPPPPIPDDGKHWKEGKVRYGMSRCINCDQPYYQHVIKGAYRCPTPTTSKKPAELSDEEILKKIRSKRRDLTVTEQRSWYEDTWYETSINEAGILRLIREILDASG